MIIESDMLYFNDGINYFYIPANMVDGLDKYINLGVRQGSFLHAVLCNDLKQTVMCADHINIANLPAYVNFLYNHAPLNCWGSPEIVERWIASQGGKR